MRQHGWFRPHVRGLTAISSTTLREGGGDIITSIFADGTDGFYFDFSKTDRLFQNLTGTPADGAGENIYLGLEGHSWGGRSYAQELAQQPEIVANGSFDTDTSSWTALSTAVLTWSSGGMQVACALFSGASQQLTLSAGRTYRLSGRVISGTGRVYINNDTTQGTPVVNLSNLTGAFETFFVAEATTYLQLSCTSSGGTVVWDDISVKAIPGNHGLQATTSAQPKWQTGGLARFDGTDDNLLTTLVPGTATSLLFDVTVPATLAATQVICGGTVGTSRCVLAINTSGQLCAGLGTDATTVIVGSTDLRSTRAKVGLVFNGSLAKLYQNAAEVYSAAQNGSAGADALRLGASNNGGTAGSFWAGDTYKALAIKKALPAAQIAAITNLWGTT